MGVEGLRIRKLAIRGIRGIEAIDVTPGDVTPVEGPTGAGKTSLFEAIRAAFVGSVDRPNLVREGHAAGSVIVELSDGTEISRTYLPNGKTPAAVVTRGGMAARQPQSYLDGLMNPYAFDPVKFLTLKPTEQAAELLGLIDLPVGRDDLLAFTGGVPLIDVEYDAPPLEVVTSIEAMLYAERTAVGRLKKTAEETAKGLGAKVPEDFDPEAVRGLNLRAMTDTLSDLRAANSERAYWAQENVKREASSTQISTKIEAGEARIEDLQRQITEQEAAIAGHEEEQQTISAAIAETSAQIEATPVKPTDEVEAQIAAFEEQRTVLATYDQALLEAARAGEQATAYDRLTGLIEDCRVAPGEWLAEADLPVEGLGYDPEAQVLTINGRQVAALSSGEQVLLAIQIAKASTRDLRLMMVDDLGLLDEETRTALITGARADEDLQWIIGWAVNTPDGKLVVDGEPVQAVEVIDVK